MAKVYYQGAWNECVAGGIFSGKLRETASWTVKDATSGIDCTVAGYGPEYLVDGNQATLCKALHNAGGYAAVFTPTITRELATVTNTSSLILSIAMINVSCNVPGESDDLDIAVYWYDASNNILSSSTLTSYIRSDGAFDHLWSGTPPTGAVSAKITALTAGLSGTSSISVGQIIASTLHTAYDIPNVDNNGVVSDSASSDRNTETIMTISGQSYDKFLYDRIVWRGDIEFDRDSLDPDAKELLGNLMHWQTVPGVYVLDGFDTGVTEIMSSLIIGQGRYGKWRVGEFSQVGTTSSIISVPFVFTENPA